MKKKQILYIAGIIISIFVVLGITFGIIFYNKSKTVVCGFYEIPSEYQTPIKTLIEDCKIKKIKFVELNEKDIASSKLNNKIDILFAFNDANTPSYSELAVPLTTLVAERIPSSIKKSEYFTNSHNIPVVMPVILDNFETSILTTVSIKYNIDWPYDLDNLEEYGRKAKQYYPAPIIIAGENDINVLSFFSEMIISFGGKTAYEEIKQQLPECEDFYDIINLSFTDADGNSITIKNVFDYFKELQRNGYIITNWSRLTEKACNTLIDDNRISAILMNLSENRRKTMPNMYYYAVSVFPVKTEYKELSIQPVLGAVAFKKSEAIRKIFEKISSADGQEFLSVNTRLGPAMLQGIPCDMQADDARYIAASTQYGPVPDLGTASLKTKEERHKLAEAIRAYFE